MDPVEQKTATENGTAVARNGTAPKAGGGKSFLPELHLAMPEWASRWLQPRMPGLALLFQKDAVVLVQVERGARGGNHRLSHVSRLELAEGSIQPSLSEVNFRSPAETSARIGRLLDQMPQRKKLARISLVLPDACARVFLLDMQELPRSRRQAEHMIKWQVRKRVPFNLDDARMAVQRFPLPEGGERIAVVLGVERVLSQYEQIVTALGLRPGLLDLATFNMANLLFLDGNETASVDEQDVALLNVADDEFSVLIMRQGVPLFYRSKPLLHHSADQAELCRRDIHRELITSGAYYRERLEGDTAGIGAAWLRVAGPGRLDLQHEVEETLGVKPRTLDPGRALDLGSASPDLLEAAAPALGVTVGRWA